MIKTKRSPQMAILLIIISFLAYADSLTFWKRGVGKLIDINRTPSPEPEIAETANLLLSLSQPRLQHRERDNFVMSTQPNRKRKKLTGFTVEQKRERINELARIRYKKGKKMYKDQITSGQNFEKTKPTKYLHAYSNKIQNRSAKSKGMWSRLREGNPTEEDRKEHLRINKAKTKWQRKDRARKKEMKKNNGIGQKTTQSK